jgi:purine-binding chemotaxis protein CheW
MKVPALEFRVGDKYFAIDMNKIKHFFEVEEVKKLPFLPHFVEGIVRYNDYAYPLISLKKAWKIEEDDGDIAVAMVFRDKEYAILIDEIVKIGELEKKKNFLVEVFEENGKLIGNLSLDFLDDVKIPTFNNHYIEKETKNQDKESFLLFECNDELIAIESEVIKKVEDLKDELINLNGVIVKVFDFQKVYRCCEAESLIILEDEKIAAFKVGKIIDIALVNKEEISESSEGVFRKFFIHKNREVKVISTSYIKKVVNKVGVRFSKKEHKTYDEKEEVLVVDILGEKFAVRMRDVVDILEYTDNLYYATDNPNIKGLITTREGATFVYSFEKYFNKELKLDEDVKVVAIKEKDVVKAFLINRIEDILYVSKEHILLSDDDGIIGGVVLDKDVIPLINPRWGGENV